MKVTILSDTKIFNSNDSVFGEIQNYLNEKLNEKEIYFSHMVIDGVEVYNNYELYIEEHLTEIKHIIIEVKSSLEFSNEIVSSIYYYSERALPEIEQLSKDFYQTSTSESWQKFGDLLEALQWIHDAIMSIDKEKQKPADWDKYITISAEFEMIFPNLLDALKSKDNILIADILTYEVIPLFKQINQFNTMKNSDDNKGILDYVEGEQ